MRRWKILARHRTWVPGAVITELVDATNDAPIHRFVATIRGYRNWRIWQGNTRKPHGVARVRFVTLRVYAIRDRIDRGDETVFQEPGAW